MSSEMRRIALETARRRDVLKATVLALALPIVRPLPVWAQPAGADQTGGVFTVRAFGAVGDGKAVDSAAINRAIEAAASSGGGTVRVPAGKYICYSVHLRSSVALYLDQGAAIIAGDTPHEG